MVNIKQEALQEQGRKAPKQQKHSAPKQETAVAPNQQEHSAPKQDTAVAIKQEPVTPAQTHKLARPTPSTTSPEASSKEAGGHGPPQRCSSWVDWESSASAEYGRGGWGYWYGSGNGESQGWRSSYGSGHGENQGWGTSYDSAHGENPGWGTSYDSGHGENQGWCNSYSKDAGWWPSHQWGNWRQRSNYYNYDPQQPATWKATLCRPGTSDLFDCGTPCKPSSGAEQLQKQAPAAEAAAAAQEPQIEGGGEEAEKLRLEAKKHHAKYMRFYRSLESQGLRGMRLLLCDCTCLFLNRSKGSSRDQPAGGEH